MKTLKDFNFKGKKVLVRCDFNVPLDEKRGMISDDFRIRQTIPTIEYLIKKGGKVILMSHLGRPEGKFIKELSLKPVSQKLEELLKRKVHPVKSREAGISPKAKLFNRVKFLPDCQGEKVEKEIEKMRPGEVILLENLRFYKEDEENERNFAKALSKLGDIFVNEAFSVCHRFHASIVGIPKYLPKAPGLLLEKEIKILSQVLKKPWRPLVVVIGGAKVSHKIKVVKKFLEKADQVLLGGKIANVILATKGILLNQPIPEPEVIKEIEKIDLTCPKLHLPVDVLISLADLETGLKEGYFRQGGPGQIRKDENAYDIGPETIKIFSRIIKEGKMIFWSGPLGMFEEEKFEKGTKEISQTIVRNHPAFKIAGGGDTLLALNKFGLIDKFDHLSIGGGAMLQFLAEETLPGIEALK